MEFEKKASLQVKKRVDGCEIRSKKGDTLHIHYVGTLQVTVTARKSYSMDTHFLKDSGVEFDRSRREEPFSFTVGSSQVELREYSSGVKDMKIALLRPLTLR